MGKILHDRLDYQPYFRALADRFGLKDWRIEAVDESPSSPTASLSVICIEGRKWARIRMSEDWLRDTEQAQRHDAVHELIHAHQAHEGHLLQKLLPEEKQDVWRLAHEYTTDSLADAIAPLLPLPSEILKGPDHGQETE